MDPITTVAAANGFIQLCKHVVEFGKRWTGSKTEFTEKEQDILKAAAGPGLIHVNTIGETLCVIAGYTGFRSPHDPALGAEYVDAFRLLCDKGLIYPIRGTTFQLTGQGFKYARELNPEATPKPTLLE